MKSLLFRRRNSAGTNNSRESAATPTPHLLARPPSPFPTPPHPPRRTPRASPRPSPDSTVASRKTHCTCHSDSTEIQSNLEKDFKASLNRTTKKRYDEWPTSSSYNLMPTTGANVDGSSSDSDDDSVVVSELTAFSTMQQDGKASLLLPSKGKKRQVKSMTTAKETSNRILKPKSIFRTRLKYTKQLSVRSLGSSDHNKSLDGIDSSKASSKADSFSSDYGVALGLPAPSNPEPKTPVTVASLDYSSDGSPAVSNISPADSDVNTPSPPHTGAHLVDLATPESALKALPIIEQHYQEKEKQRRQFQKPPSPPRRTGSSSSSFSGDTFSTITTKDSATVSVKSAPEPRRMEALAEARSKMAASTRLHRRSKSDSLDELFSTVLSMTDEPLDIEDILAFDVAVAFRRRNTAISSPKSLPAKSSNDVQQHVSRGRELLQNRVQPYSDTISGMTLVKRDEARRHAAAAAQQNKHLVPRFHGVNGREIPQHSPNMHKHRQHHRKPSREEYVISTPHIPALMSTSNQQAAANPGAAAARSNRNSSPDDIERGRMSPHVQFRDEKLCSFYSGRQSANASSSNLNGGNIQSPSNTDRLQSEQEDERLESEIYQTMLSMAAFDIQVEDLHDMSDEGGSDDTVVSSLSSSNHWIKE